MTTTVLQHTPVYDDDYANKYYVDKAVSTSTDAVVKTLDYSKNWGVQPTPPYHVNDTWSLDGQLYICITERLIGEYNSADWKAIINTVVYDEFIENVYTVSQLEIPIQHGDTILETWFTDTDPSITWTDDIEKYKHQGDLWMKKTSRVQYRYKLQSSAILTLAWERVDYPTNLYDVSEVYSGKRTIFLEQPTTYNSGDFWIIDYSVTTLPPNTIVGQIVRANVSNTTYDALDWVLNDVNVVNVTSLDDKYTTQAVTNVIFNEVTHNYESAISQAIDAIELTVSDTYATQDTVSNLSIYVGEIESTVSTTNEITQNQLGTINNTLSTMNETILTQTESSFLFWFEQTGFKQTVDTVSALATSNNADMITLNQYIRFVDGTIELGRNDSQVKLVLQNDKISFMTGSNESAYITNNTLYITDQTILMKQQIANWLTYADTSGNLNTRWIGGA